MNIKRISVLAFLLCVTVLFSSCGDGAVRENGGIYGRFENGEYVLEGIEDKANGEFTVPEKLSDGAKVTAISMREAENVKSLTMSDEVNDVILISDSIESLHIGAKAWNDDYVLEDKFDSRKKLGNFRTDNLKTITASDKNPYYYVKGNCLLTRETGILLLCCPGASIPEEARTLSRVSQATETDLFVIPEGIRSIRDGAFASCEGIKAVYIPKSVTSIEGGAFIGTPELVIYCEAAEKPEGWAEHWILNNPYVSEKECCKEVIWGATLSDLNGAKAGE